MRTKISEINAEYFTLHNAGRVRPTPTNRLNGWTHFCNTVLSPRLWCNISMRIITFHVYRLNRRIQKYRPHESISLLTKKWDKFDIIVDMTNVDKMEASRASNEWNEQINLRRTLYSAMYWMKSNCRLFFFLMGSTNSKIYGAPIYLVF